MSDSRPSRPGRSPLRGRYLVRNRAWNAFLAVADGILGIALPRPSGQGAGDQSRAPKRVLVCVGGHIGDAIIATNALSQLHRNVPGIEIGVLSGSWNRAIFESHPR